MRIKIQVTEGTIKTYLFLIPKETKTISEIIENIKERKEFEKMKNKDLYFELDNAIILNDESIEIINENDVLK
jgi:hypothetical protein